MSNYKFLTQRSKQIIDNNRFKYCNSSTDKKNLEAILIEFERLKQRNEILEFQNSSKKLPI